MGEPATSWSLRLHLCVASDGQQEEDMTVLFFTAETVDAAAETNECEDRYCRKSHVSRLRPVDDSDEKRRKR
jgi:hypothetical protein